MTRSYTSLRVFCLLPLMSLAACNGSAPSGTTTAPPAAGPTQASQVAPTLRDTSSNAQSSLSSVVLNSTSRSTSSSSGTLDRAANTATVAGQSGTIDAARRILSIAAGGQVTLDAANGRYAARFSAAPQSGPSATGIVGIPTTSVDMPTSGSATLSGTSTLTAQVGADLYELDGTATTTAVFGPSGTVSTTISNLSGDLTPALGSTTSVTNVGTLTIANATLVGDTFTGGTGTTTGATLALSGGQTTQQNGQFYGPQAGEAGAVFVIDDQAATGPLIMGDILVD